MWLFVLSSKEVNFLLFYPYISTDDRDELSSKTDHEICSNFFLKLSFLNVTLTISINYLL